MTDTPTLEAIRKAIENIPTPDAVTKSVLADPALTEVLKSVVDQAVADVVVKQVRPAVTDARATLDDIDSRLHALETLDAVGAGEPVYLPPGY